MSNTGYDHGQVDLALGYRSKSDDVADPVNPRGLFAAAALYSTVEDLYLFDQALYTDKLVSQKTLDTMFTGYVQNPHYPTGMKVGYGGYTIVLPSRPRLTEGVGYINGFGFVSVVHRWPDDNIIIIILTNQQDVYAWDNAAAINRELFGR
jgi:CubicO group peptidase (beta-lactamase class C family)